MPGVRANGSTREAQGGSALGHNCTKAVVRCTSARPLTSSISVLRMRLYLNMCTCIITSPDAASHFKRFATTIAVHALNCAAHVTQLIVHDQASLETAGSTRLAIHVSMAAALIVRELDMHCEALTPP